MVNWCFVSLFRGLVMSAEGVIVLLPVVPRICYQLRTNKQKIIIK